MGPSGPTEVGTKVMGLKLAYGTHDVGGKSYGQLLGIRQAVNMWSCQSPCSGACYALCRTSSNWVKLHNC